MRRRGGRAFGPRGLEAARATLRRFLMTGMAVRGTARNRSHRAAFSSSVALLYPAIAAAVLSAKLRLSAAFSRRFVKIFCPTSPLRVASREIRSGGVREEPAASPGPLPVWWRVRVWGREAPPGAGWASLSAWGSRDGV